MPGTRRRRPRLSWFRFFVDDFDCGTSTLTATDTGNYVRTLCAQWSSKARCAIPADIESLKLICRGDAPSARVLEKFDVVMVEGVKYLRNQKLCDEYADSAREYLAKRRGGKRTAQREDTASESVTESVTDSVPPPRGRARESRIQTRPGRGGDEAREEATGKRVRVSPDEALRAPELPADGAGVVQEGDVLPEQGRDGEPGGVGLPVGGVHRPAREVDRGCPGVAQDHGWREES